MAKDIFGNRIETNLNKIAFGSVGSNSNAKFKRQSIGRSQKDVVFSRQNGKCAICKKPLNPLSTHYDHKKEVSKGGKSTTDNLRAICANCHSQRHKEDKARELDKKKSRQSIRRQDNSFNLFGGNTKRKNLWDI